MVDILCKECDKSKIETGFQQKYRQVKGVLDRSQPYRDVICRLCRASRFSANSSHFDKAFHNARTQISKAKHPETQLLSGARMRAKSKGLPFSITKQDIVIPKYCPMLGIKLERGVGVAHGASPTLDKIVPNKGYVKGNVWVISQRANIIKSNATAEEIIRVGVALQMQLEDV